MKKLVTLVAGFSVLVFGFQNCSQQQGSESLGSAASSTNQTKIEDPDLKMAKAVEILTQASNQKVTLDLETGSLTQSTATGSTEKCLSESMRAAINDVIQNSSLCEFKPAEGELCAHVYGYPYADIQWDDMSVKVGESMSSCHKGPDLCGQDGKTLRGLLRDVISRWDEWSCDFQSL